jgi:hypothetical protein
MTASTQHGHASTSFGKAEGSHALIVTWNPDGEGTWRQVGYREAIERTARGQVVKEDWSTGTRKTGVGRGDRVFMLQQGDHGRGIIASGSALGEIRQDKHWRRDRPDELANTVDVQWEHVVWVEDALPRDVLERELPAKHRWLLQGSGVLIPGELADPLEKLWSSRLAGIAQNTGEAPEVAAVAVDQVPLAAIPIERTEVRWSVSKAVTQKEAQLTSRFQAYLEEHERKVKRYRIIPVGSAALYSDLADVTENILYEAKGSADRMSVRLALGQVLDYGRFVGGSRLAVLLPEAPSDDLIELLEKHDVGCVVETTRNQFLDMTAHNRCP